VASVDKVLVDSSVWIDYFAGDGPTVRALNALVTADRIVICGQIVQEVLQGSRDDKAFARLERRMTLWPVEPEERADFVEAARVFARLRWKGVTIPPTDCLVAAVALRRGLPLYANDADFDHIPGLLRHRPSGERRVDERK
jgi:predicted nucleic acid-binding protein